MIGKTTMTVALLFAWSAPAWTAEKEGQAGAEDTTVQWVCAKYPARVHALLAALDLDLAGLEEAKAAFARGDSVAASQAVLEYYRTCGSGKWLRWKESPQPGDARDATADVILNDTFTINAQTDRVPRRKDGGRTWTHEGPTHDIAWARQLNRHAHLAVLLEAAKSTGNRDYARAIDADIRDWAASVPFPGRPHANPPWGTGLDVSFRAKRWTEVFYGLQNEPLLTPAARLLLLTRLPEHAHYQRHWHREGNWLTMELSGLAIIAAGFPEFRQAKEWFDYAKHRLIRELSQQVYPDGAQVELTTTYHWVALRNFEQFAGTCRGAGIVLPEEYAAGLEKMWNYQASIMGPIGQSVANNDSNHFSLRTEVLSAAETYGRPDWTYIATNGAQGSKPQYGPSIMLPWAGQLVVRSGWDSNAVWAFFDVGPWGTAHQHNDKLHLSVSAYGRDLLVDSGRFTYGGENIRFQRQYGVLSRAHNVLLLDGQGQRGGPARARKPLAAGDWSVSPETTFARGTCDFFDGIVGRAAHARAVLYLPDKLIVVGDRIETDRPRKLQALWHWHPRCTVQAESGTVVSTDADAGNLRIVPVTETGWKTEIVKGQEKPHLQGWFAHEYNVWEPNPTAVLTSNIAQSTAFAWLLLPARGEVDMVRGTIVANTADALRIRIERAGKQTLAVTIPWRNGKPLVEASPPQATAPKQ